MNYEEQVHKGWTIVVLIALSVALAVIFYFGYSSRTYGSEPTTDVLAQFKQPLVECDTDLDCMLKNPSPNGDYVDYSSTQIDPDGFMGREE